LNGFHAPSLGNIVSVLFSSSLEGDPQLTGDHFLVGDTSSLSYPTNAISGPNNPANNFFASQINTILPLITDPLTGKLMNNGSATIDTRGSFGTSNSNGLTGTAVSGARQGYDITAIDIGSLIENDQVQFYAQGTTDQDVYTVNALGVQIQVLAPLIQAIKTVDQSTVTLGTTVTYTSTFTNLGEATATDLVFTDILPTGVTLVPDTVTVNGSNVSGADLVGGIPLGDLEVTDSVVVVFQAQVTQYNPPNSYANASEVTYSFVPLNSSAPTVGLSSQTNTVTSSGPEVDPPVANPDTATTTANVGLSGLNVLTNDTGTDIGVTASDSSSVQGGSVVVQFNGFYNYNPPTNFSGTDSFNYTITDSIGQTASTTVTITVTPVATNDSGSVAANTLLTQTTSVLSNDIGSNLTVSTYDTSSAEGGTVVMQPDGTYTYLPPSDFSGIDTFNYTAIDSSENTAIGVVTIRVLPVAENNTGSTPANTALNGSTIFTNDVGTGLTLVSYQPVSIQGGTVVMNMETGTYTYTPPNNFSGTDTFTYTVEDESGQQTVGTVTIMVLPVGVNDTGTTSANISLNQTTSVLANDLGSSLTIQSYNQNSVQGGTVVMQSDGTYLYTPPANFSGPDAFNYTAVDGSLRTTTAHVNLTVLPVANPDSTTTVANTMNVNGAYTYSPPLNFSGIDTFTYTATDFYGNLVSSTVTIDVQPIIDNETYTTNANVPVSGNLLTNDIGSGLTVTPGRQTTLHGGTVILQADGSFTYIPPPNFFGTDNFTYTVTDGSENTAMGTATIHVLAVSPPACFTGTVVKYVFLNKKDYRLNMVWCPSPSTEVTAYRIYYKDRLIAEVSANQLSLEWCIASAKDAKYFSITAVNTGGAESAHLNIRIES
jgi:uncharacterized repeat protein (TIGR01451 family)